MNRKLFFLFVFFISNSLHAQKLTHELIDQFMHSGSLTLKTIRKDTVRELAHSIEFPRLMAWLPGKDYAYPVKHAFQVTSSYVPTRDEKSLYIVVMIPDNVNNMNIRVDKIEDGTLKGELLIPEFMFYDPQNPPKLPPPTYVHISRDYSRLKHFFTKENLKGTTWEVAKVEGCALDMPFVFTLGAPGEAQAKAKGQETFLSWDIPSSGGYIFLEPGDFSERIVGMKVDEQTIEAYSDLTRCRLLIKRK